MNAAHVSPAAGADAVRERILAAREQKAKLRVVGGGAWKHAGRQVSATQSLSLAHDRGIVEYVPGDLTLTARAGATLAEIETATREHDQWLPLDPWGGDSGTIGATVSTATAGPHAYAMGLPRDVVLGVEMVSGTGQIIRAGGRVVKNVAGFDLTRLAVGSWGTLGVVTEVTVRLRARPPETRTVVLAAPGDASALSAIAAKVRALPFAPLACELVDARLAALLGLPSRSAVIVRVAGNARAVAAQLDHLRGLTAAHDAPDDIWKALREIELTGCASWRWSQLPSAFGDTWTAAAHATRSLHSAMLHASVMRGVVRVLVPIAANDSASDMARAATAFTGTTAIEALPAAAWQHVDLSPAQDAVSRAIRLKFDPDGVLNPGILGDA